MQEMKAALSGLAAIEVRVFAASKVAEPLFFRSA
jgi:hypothetical protein